jgi:DNA-binding MarR family transcriptional regulator
MDMSYQRAESAGYLTNWAGRLFVRAIEKRLTGGNAGPMPVFFALLTEHALTQKELAAWATVEQPTMANTLKRMERDGLIKRTPNPGDARSALISLSRLGQQRATEAMDSAAEVNGIALAGFKPAERELFFDMLRRVARNLEADAEGESAPPALQVGKRAR